jgi:hypothetical protein
VPGCGANNRWRPHRWAEHKRHCQTTDLGPIGVGIHGVVLEVSIKLMVQPESPCAGSLVVLRSLELVVRERRPIVPSRPFDTFDRIQRSRRESAGTRTCCSERERCAVQNGSTAGRGSGFLESSRGRVPGPGAPLNRQHPSSRVRDQVSTSTLPFGMGYKGEEPGHSPAGSSWGDCMADHPSASRQSCPETDVASCHLRLPDESPSPFLPSGILDKQSRTVVDNEEGCGERGRRVSNCCRCSCSSSHSRGFEDLLLQRGGWLGH